MAIALLLSFGGTAFGQAGSVVYLKQDTREASRKASIEATRKQLGEFKAGAWSSLGKIPVREALKFNSDGLVNLSSGVAGPEGKMLQWQPAPKLADATWHVIGCSMMPPEAGTGGSCT